MTVPVTVVRVMVRRVADVLLTDIQRPLLLRPAFPAGWVMMGVVVGHRVLLRDRFAPVGRGDPG
ncbi:hypothetical protein [Euzebya sp.]|uniref:hypothetical protein n=1 Tax=Euzebya sp. TaxID=1971409 RepID=UPI003512DA28